jgi:NAD(P)-dependent dehydrogenase (short-subunit alcohol dehydrogenase family)
MGKSVSFFNNKIVVVTGGNSGIGQAIAEEFNKQGAKIVIFARNKDKLKQVKNKLENSIAVSGDVCKISDLDKLFKITNDKLGKIDILIANAGIASRRGVEKVDENYFDEMVNTNFKGVYFTVQRSIPFLNNHASIILISSMACHAGWPSHSVYSATKAAVSMLAKNFSADLIPKGIRVNAISPGFTATDVYEANFIAEYKKRIPTSEFVKPEEIAKAAIYLSSPEAMSIVGVDLVIDGGFTSIIKE